MDLWLEISNLGLLMGIFNSYTFKVSIGINDLDRDDLAAPKSIKTHQTHEAF
ncbi:unnamed protein product [Penicillium glandicola]